MGETKKCVVWDLDNTVWDGVLLEGDELTVRPGVRGRCAPWTAAASSTRS
ncbi:hypothetical protein ACWV95_01430 [Streptomyces albus]